MNEIIIWIWAFIIAIGISSMVIVPLLGLCYHFAKIKMRELKDKVGH